MGYSDHLHGTYLPLSEAHPYSYSSIREPHRHRTIETSQNLCTPFCIQDFSHFFILSRNWTSGKAFGIGPNGGSATGVLIYFVGYYTARRRHIYILRVNQWLLDFQSIQHHHLFTYPWQSTASDEMLSSSFFVNLVP
jgi:hypothetical protein